MLGLAINSLFGPTSNPWCWMEGGYTLPNAQRFLVGKQSLLLLAGQVVAYEIMASTQTSCPLEIMKIPVPPGDSVGTKKWQEVFEFLRRARIQVYDIDGTGTEIPFTRAKYDKQSGQGFNSPREQVRAHYRYSKLPVLELSKNGVCVSKRSCWVLLMGNQLCLCPYVYEGVW